MKQIPASFILFLDNESGEPQVFPMFSQKVFKFLKSGWIESILRRDEDNIVQIMTIFPILDPNKSFEEGNAVFSISTSDLESGNLEKFCEVEPSEKITINPPDDKIEYFVIKDNIARIEAIMENPIGGYPKFVFELDEKVISALPAKIEAIMNKEFSILLDAFLEDETKASKEYKALSEFFEGSQMELLFDEMSKDESKHAQYVRDMIDLAKKTLRFSTLISCLHMFNYMKFK